MVCGKFNKVTSRREMLRSSAAGFGSLALAGIASRDALGSIRSGVTAVDGGGLHFPARAKRIIFLFMWGGPSHVDLFDPKPVLNREAGKPLAGSSVGAEQESLGTVLGTPFCVRPARGRRHLDERTVSRAFPTRRSLVRGPLDAHRGKCARRGAAASAHGPGKLGAAECRRAG